MAEDKAITEKLFGKKFSEIPCFRRSFLTGISSGLGIGLAHFLMTSNTRKSTNVGFFSYVGITTAVWCVCRYDYGIKLVMEQRYKRAIASRNSLEGTELEKKLRDKDTSDV